MDAFKKRLKLSELTYIYPAYDGPNGHLVVSNLSGASVVVDNETREFLEKLRTPGIPAELWDASRAQDVQKMYEVRMLIDESVSGYDLLRQTIDECKALKTLEMVLVVTSQCNMACPYCFEKQTKGAMDSQLIARLLQYTTKRIDEEGLRHVNTILYGGEPLLNVLACKEWLTSLREKTEQRGVQLTAGLITNGTLITGDFLDFYAQFNTPMVQITIDGPRDIHNQRRILKNRQGSYELLLDNLVLIADYDINLAIRINIDRENFDHIPELINDLKQRGLNRPNVVICMERVVGETCTNAYQLGKCFEATSFIETITPYALEFRRKGFNLSFKHTNTLRPIYCRAYSDKQIVVESDGILYTCLSGVGNEQFVVGNLYHDPIYNERFQEWANCSAANFAKCRTCDAVGFCGAGCGAEALVVHGTLQKEPVCSMLKGYVGGVVLPAKIRNQFLSLKK